MSTDARPYRDRAEMYALKDGKLFGGLYDHGGFGVFGGGIDPGEDPAVAAAREFAEETGHSVSNPRLLPIDPLTLDWNPPFSSEKLKERAKHFRGSRTHYVVGDYGGPIPDAKPDELGRKDLRLYGLDEASRLTGPVADSPGLSAANARRAQVLLHLMQTKTSAASPWYTGGTEKIAAESASERLGSVAGGVGAGGMMLGSDWLTKRLLAAHDEPRQLSFGPDRVAAVRQSRETAALLDAANRGRDPSLPRIQITPQGYAGGAGAYNTGSGEILAGNRHNVGVLAHELGHARQRTQGFLPRLGDLSRRVGYYGMLGGVSGPVLSSDETTGRNAALVGSASTLPLLVNEIDASRRGGQLIRQALPGRRPFAAFRGLPSYATMTLAPLVAHYGKKLFGGYTAKEAEEKTAMNNCFAHGCTTDTSEYGCSCNGACPDCKPKREKDAARHGRGSEDTMRRLGLSKTAGDDDTMLSAAPAMRGWQWKALQRDENDAMKSWTPRLFHNEATPLTELLASPGKQGLLKGLLGGAVGAGAGYLTGQIPGLGIDPLHAAGVGAAGGALIGGVRGYGKRREENDNIIDALRRLPPGAVVRDYDRLKKQDEAEAEKTAVDIVLKDGTNLGDHTEVGEKFARKLYDAAAGTHSSELLHNAMADAMQKMRFPKEAATAPMQRSAVGESGLAFKHDNSKDKFGMEAWKEVSDKYSRSEVSRKLPEPLKGNHNGEKKGSIAEAFFAKLAFLGVEDLHGAVEKAAALAPEVADELRAALMEKTAIVPNWLKNLPTLGREAWQGARGMFSGARAAAPAAAEAAGAARAAAPGAGAAAAEGGGLWRGVRNFFGGAAPEAGAAATAAAPAAGAASSGWRTVGNTLNTAMGGFGGYHDATHGYDYLTGNDNHENSFGRVGTGLLGALAGGAVMSPRGRQAMMATPNRRIGGAPLVHGIQGRYAGQFTGMLGDAAGSAAGFQHTVGYDQNGQPIREGGFGLTDTLGNIGGGFGLARGLGSSMQGLARLSNGGRIPAAGTWGRTFNSAGRGLERMGEGAMEAVGHVPYGLSNLARGLPYGSAYAPGGLQRLGATIGLGAAGAYSVPRLLRSAGEGLGRDALNTVAAHGGPLIDGAMDRVDYHLMNRLHSMGLVDQNGRFSLGGAAGNAFGGLGNAAIQGIDHMIRAAGGNPAAMTTAQKMLLAGGTAMGGMGLMTGNPAMGLAGSGTALAGLLPLLRNGQQGVSGSDHPLANLMTLMQGSGQQQGQGPQGPNQMPSIGPQYRNEFQLMQQLQGQHQ